MSLQSKLIPFMSFYKECCHLIHSIPKARGMPHEHATTGFLTIPEGATHGQELFCSSRECFLEGVKFRYCSHCNKAVAKRNFKMRHSHSNVTSNVTKPNDASIFSDSSAENNEAKPQNSATDFRDSNMMTVDVSKYKPPLVLGTTVFSSAQSKSDVSSLESESDEYKCYKKICHRRKQPPKIWNDLFFSRPVDTTGTDMHEWLIRVIAASKQRDDEQQHFSVQQNGRAVLQEMNMNDPNVEEYLSPIISPTNGQAIGVGGTNRNCSNKKISSNQTSILEI